MPTEKNGAMTPAAVRRLRRRLGLTQTALGRLVGVWWVTVSRWETGARRVPEPTARLLRRLARELGDRREVRP